MKGRCWNCTSCTERPMLELYFMSAKENMESVFYSILRLLVRNARGAKPCKVNCARRHPLTPLSTDLWTPCEAPLQVQSIGRRKDTEDKITQKF